MSRVLVAYFSASGVTAKLAGSLAAAIGADLFEIKPEVPYTKADLNWMNRNSRSSVEMKDRNCRPGIASVVDDMEKYSTVFVGFPIWWYREPSIIDTFMDSYDFGGKVVVPFATSGSSGMGDSASNLKSLALAADVREGKRFPRKVSEEELRNWAAEYLG